MQESKVPESVKLIKGEWLESETWRHQRQGSNDYKTHQLYVEKVVDRNGVEYRPFWGDDGERKELCAGVELFTRDRIRWLRIHRSACPVRVLWAEYYEYVSYDSSDDNTSWKTRWWSRYEAPPASTGDESAT